MCEWYLFFFFQAEDGIRDVAVTGVQTCALPISESRGAFDEGAETESDQENLQAAIGGNGRDRLLHDLELASLDGYVIEEDGGDDNPNDFEETKSRAVEEAGNSQEGWHLKGENDDKDGGCRAGNGTNVRFQAKAGKESQKHQDGESRDDRGKPPMPHRVVNLCPSHNDASMKRCV